jgi:hypothetical protein
MAAKLADLMIRYRRPYQLLRRHQNPRRWHRLT